MQIFKEPDDKLDDDNTGCHENLHDDNTGCDDKLDDHGIKNKIVAVGGYKKEETEEKFLLQIRRRLSHPSTYFFSFLDALTWIKSFQIVVNVSWFF